MTITFSALPADRLDEIARFLHAAFPAEAPNPAFRRDVLRWKLFDEHPLWPGSRSHALDEDGAIVAHGSVSPLRFGTEGPLVDSMYIIDWAGSSHIPGSGLLIFRRSLELGQTLLAIGGSADTLRLIPRLKWFSPRAGMRRHARPLRPFRAFGAVPAGGPRALAKLGRNLLWTSLPPLPSGGEWRCERVERFDQAWTPVGAFTPIHRTAEWLNYLLRCPALPFEGIVLARAGGPAGHAVLASAGGQVRVVDFVIEDQFKSEQRSAFAALTRWVASRPDAVEIVAASSLEDQCATFEACGLRYRATAPVHIADPGNRLPPALPLEINMLIGDAAYFVDETFPYWC